MDCKKIFKIRLILKIILMYFTISFNTLKAQDFVKKDSIGFQNSKYLLTHISFGESNLTKYFKVFVVNSTDYNKTYSEIIKCAKSQKSEYSEFYVLSVPSNKISNINDKLLTELYLNIDNQRMKENLSTSLIKCKYNFSKDSQDLSSAKFEYFLNEENTLKEVDNYALQIKPSEVCVFIKR